MGQGARQFTKLLLSLLSHAGLNWWAATVLPRALRFKRPLHHCNACSPTALLDRDDGGLQGISKWSQPTVTLRPGLAYDAWGLA